MNFKTKQKYKYPKKRNSLR